MDLPSSEDDVVGRLDTLGDDLLREDLEAPLPFLDTFRLIFTLFVPLDIFCCGDLFELTLVLFELAILVLLIWCRSNSTSTFCLM